MENNNTNTPEIIPEDTQNKIDEVTNQKNQVENAIDQKQDHVSNLKKEEKSLKKD